MKQDLVWPLFLTGITALVVVFASLLSIDLYRYYQLKCQVPVEHLEASVTEQGPSRFFIEVDYLYRVDKNRYCRHQSLKKEVYKNSWIAMQRVEKLKDQQTQVWYHPEKPHLGVVTKAFPYKRLVSTGVLFAVFAYFCFLGRCLLKRTA